MRSKVLPGNTSSGDWATTDVIVASDMSVVFSLTSDEYRRKYVERGTWIWEPRHRQGYKKVYLGQSLRCQVS